LWPWKRDATVSEDYALMMMMMMMMMVVVVVSTQYLYHASTTPQWLSLR